MADREIDKWQADRPDRLRVAEQELLAATSALAGVPDEAALERANRALYDYILVLAGEDVPLPEGWHFVKPD